ncbi:MAG: prephenate dehydrogenase [Candidatus Sericytochromatia bacterium]|nr:prephenate dehydrogenase [Candidatus Sericytochromatia bacterium]
MIITIIGVGLIGGSIALALKDNNFSTKIIGVDQSAENISKALELGIIDQSLELKEAIKISDLIIISIPVNVTTNVLHQVMDNISYNTVVTDVGSTKREICHSIIEHPKRKNFVASHPIAGTEHSGPQAALRDLFINKFGIICDQEKSSDFALKTVENMYRALQMKLVYMDSASHDLHIAYVSHLSHISSFALGVTVLEKEKDESTIFNLAGSGFESTVRLAKSSPEMWSPIFEQNSENISEALSQYIKQLENFKSYIDNKEFSKCFQVMTEANEIRRVLDGISKGVLEKRS